MKAAELKETVHLREALACLDEDDSRQMQRDEREAMERMRVAAAELADAIDDCYERMEALEDLLGLERGVR